MRTKLFLAAMLAGTFLNAQYFHTTISSGSFEQGHDGASAAVGGQGHLITGITSAFSSQGLLITRTDINGELNLSPSFSLAYDLVTPANVPLLTRSAKILELPNGNIFVTGICYESPTPIYAPDLFTAVVDPNGNPIVAMRWQLCSPNNGTDIYPSLSACLDPNNPNIVYITGASNVISPTPYFTPFAMALNLSTNTLIWSGFYDVPKSGSQGLFPTDIIFSPYSVSGNYELMIVGTSYDFGTSQFTYLIDAATGNTIGLINLFNGEETTFFDAVAVAPGSGGGQSGFIISGTCMVNGRMYTVATKVDPSGSTVLWTNYYVHTSGDYSIWTDVVERMNTSGNWEYYISANLVSGLFGGGDVTVYKIDDNGICQDEFTYGTANVEQALEISKFDQTSADGISVYGSLFNGSQWDALLIKAYFNGVSGCNENLNRSDTYKYDWRVIQEDIKLDGHVCGNQLILHALGWIPDAPICPVQPSVPGGSNARVIEQTTATVTSANIYPNPVSASKPMLNVILNASSAGEVRFTLTDMLGREVAVQTSIAAAGEAQYSLVLPSDLPAGIYNVRISGNGLAHSERLVIE